MLSLDYIAGLFDGEGFFTMRRVKGAKGITVRPWRYQCYAQIVMRDGFLLQEVVDSLGFGWCTPTKEETEKHAQYFGFGVTGINLRLFCERVGPRLRLKREQAQLTREVCIIKSKIGNRSVSDRDYQRQEEIWENLKRLNAKGPRKLIEPIVPVVVSAWEANQ